MVKSFANALAKHDKLGLVSHVNPDGDAIGSQLALSQWLEHRGVATLLFNDDPVPSNLTWLEHQEKIQPATRSLLDKCDGFVFVDGNHPSRFGNIEACLRENNKPVYLIDHHLEPPEDFFHAMLWNSGASSTAYLVYKLFELTGLDEITKDVAEALYCGILTDTGSFRFDSVTAETHFAIGEIIMRGGISPSELYNRIYEDKTPELYQLLGMNLNSIRLFCDGRLAISHVTEQMLAETGCSYDDIDGFVNYPLSIGGVVVSVLLYERDGRIKASLRGKSVVDLNRVARKFDGGGHFNAAGAWHEGPLDRAVESMVSEISRHLEK